MSSSGGPPSVRGSQETVTIDHSAPDPPRYPAGGATTAGRWRHCRLPTLRAGLKMEIRVFFFTNHLIVKIAGVEVSLTY